MSPSTGQCQTLPLVNIGAEWKPERRAFIRLSLLFGTHIEFKWELPSASSWQHFGIMTPDSTQMKGLKYHQRGTWTPPTTTPPPNTTHHHLHTLQCTDMRYMCIKTHFLLCGFIAHVLHNVPESQFPTAGTVAAVKVCVGQLTQK